MTLNIYQLSTVVRGSDSPAVLLRTRTYSFRDILYSCSWFRSPYYCTSVPTGMVLPQSTLTERFENLTFENWTFWKPDVLKPDVLKPNILKPDVLKPDVLWVYHRNVVRGTADPPPFILLYLQWCSPWLKLPSCCTAVPIQGCILYSPWLRPPSCCTTVPTGM
jgi:hypothetical protein